MRQLPMHLPALREELQLLPGAPLANGAPTWLIYDPVRATFIQIGIELYDILSLWSANSTQALAQRYRLNLGRELSEQSIADAIVFLVNNQLTQQSASGDYQGYFERQKSSRQSAIGRLSRQYLFFRIPLLQPHNFLRRTLPYVNALYSRLVATLLLLITVAGLLLVLRQPDTFTAQFANLFNANGLAIYLVSLVGVKILHELGHAYTATRYGARVSTMGIAFLVMVPVLYTDTTDAWRLDSFRKRVHIDAAGVIVELAVAGIATFVWVFLSDGPVRSAVFALATTGWLLTLLINFNPFMRFDGYYLLADLLRVPNLQPRSFELSKWFLRELLFGLAEPAPEPRGRLFRFMIAYGFAVWIYRFFLFLAIALIVYAFFFKVLGIILFILEIFWFIAMPVIKELQVWWNKRQQIVASSRSAKSLAVATAIIALFFMPLFGTVFTPGVLMAEDINVIYSKQHGYIDRIDAQQHRQVHSGESLFQLRSPELEYQLESIDGEIALLRARSQRRAADQRDRAESIVIRQQTDSALSRRNGVETALEQLHIRARADGEIVDINPELHPGLWINPNTPLATLANRSRQIVKGYLREEALDRVAVGQSGWFVPDDASQPSLAVTLSSISQANAEKIDIDYLASHFGGDIAVVRESTDNIALKSVYQVEFSVDSGAGQIRHALRGVVRMRGERRSLAQRLWQSIARVTIREMGV